MASLRRKLPSANALFVFEAAARHLSFTRAAAELNVTQPAVSRMLARLEEHLQTKLFQRERSGLELTQEGGLLFRRITEGFRPIEEALTELEARRTGTEVVTLSVSTAFTTHWLMPRINKLQKAFPSVDLRFQLLSGPLAGPVDDVDLAMRFVAGVGPSHEAVLLSPEILLPICSPGYHDEIARGGPPVVINLSSGQPEWIGRFPRLASTAGGSPTALHVSDYSVVVQAALLGQGIALGWVNVASHWLRSGSLVPAVDEACVTGRLCQMVSRSDRPMRPVVRGLRDWIIEETRQDIAEVDRLYPHLGLAAACRSGPSPTMPA